MPDQPLDQFAAAIASGIASGKPVRILAVGSATTVGEDAEGGHSISFPYRMTETLRARMPRTRFELTVRGKRGLTAEAMLPLVTDALQHGHYPLVVWQTGTVEAVRGLRPDGMRAVLEEGAQQVREAGGDLVLVDPQFSRFLRANTDLDPYENALQQITTLPGVVLFHRYELMRSWASDGRIDLERTQKAEREKTVEQLNTCLGETLAEFLLNGVDVKPP
jgi:acyl-CoA thioesterase I